MASTRKIQCPVPNDEWIYMAHCQDTGEILQSADIAPILRIVVKNLERDPLQSWTIDGFRNLHG